MLRISLLLCALFGHSALAAAAPVTLRVVLPTNNPGTVTALGGINCTPFCSASYEAGSTVTLFAWPDGNSTFGGWNYGNCGASRTCAVTVTADTTVAATFNGPSGGGSSSSSSSASSSSSSASSSSTGGGQSTYRLTVVLPTRNPGTVTGAGGINCTPFCTATYAAGATVTLNEYPDGSSVFGGWSYGSCGTARTCAVTLNGDTTVTATFNGPGGGSSSSSSSVASSSSSSVASSSSSSVASSSSSSVASSSSSSVASSSSSSLGGNPNGSIILQARYLDSARTSGPFAYYDPALNITWLRVTDAGAGSRFDDGKFSNDGRMTWGNATAWVSSLSFNTPGGSSGWRLPSIDTTGGLTCVFSLTGGTACGQNVITTPGQRNYSEMAHMNEVTLGNVPSFNRSGGINPLPWLRNIGPFNTLHQDWNAVWYGSPSCDSDLRNCRDDAYWTNVQIGGGGAWKYLFGEGEQIGDSGNVEYFAWAVHDGDVGYP